MAQAARLSMRMQKELKLLLSDPPHGASFPHLSSAAAGSGDFSTFTTIDAQIEGPEDSVYANGIFNVKIQIPERYPFQPPIVAFATPIYHPNIDNGGRICLDILNLPPKGAWQPSLNILTVLTSIGLLLSEPNPDDGLMYEVSREYKYNRQTFDYKAREMTEKYAKVNADGSGSSVSFQSQKSPNRCENHGDEKVSLAGNHEKPTHRENCDTTDATKGVPNSQLLLSSSRDQQEDGNGKRKALIGNDEIKTSRKKLSLALPPQSQTKEDLLLGGGVSAACKENMKPKKLSLGLKEPFNDNLGSSSFRIPGVKSDNNKLSRKLSLRPLGESNEVSKTEVLAQTEMELEMNQNEDGRSLLRGEFENSGLEETSMPESIVVLDSDDSGEEEEEETVSARSRLSLARRRGLKCRP